MQYEQINEKISEELNANNKKINELSYKIKVFEINDLDNKLMIFLVFAMMNYFTGILLMTIFFSNIITLFQKGIINVNMLSILNFVFPITSGIVGGKWYLKKCNLKKRLNKVTSSKSRSKRFSEQVKYEVEREKLINRNNILNSISEKIDEEKKMLYKLSSNYNFINKDSVLEHKLLGDNLLDNKYNEMDLLGIKKFLIDKFWKVRCRSQKILEIFLFSVLGGAFLMFYWNVPVMVINRFLDELVISVNILWRYANLVVPFLLGSVGIGLYINRNYNIREQVFDSLNRELLKENVLSKKDSISDNVIEEKLNVAMNEIVDLRLEMFRRNTSEKEYDIKDIKDKDSFCYKFDLEKNRDKNDSLETIEKLDNKENKLVKKREK